MSKNTSAVGLPTLVPLALIDDDWKHNASRQFLNKQHEERSMAVMFNEKSGPFHDLTTDVKANGLKSALIIRPSGVKGGKAKQYILVAGFRRIRALKVLGWTEAPCIIEPDSMDDAKAFETNVRENVLRESVTKFGLGMAAVTYYDRFGKAKEGANGKKFDKTAEGEGSASVAAKFGVSGSYLRGIMMVRNNVADPILVAWSDREHGMEETDHATFAATGWVKMLEYAGIKDKEGAPDHKTQLAAFELARVTEKLLSDNKVTREQADKEAKDLLAKGGYSFDALNAGGKATGNKGGGGKHSIPKEAVVYVQKSLKAVNGTRKGDEKLATDAVLAFADYLLKGLRKGARPRDIVVNKMVIFEVPKGDVK